MHATHTVDGFAPNLPRSVLHRSAFMLPGRPSRCFSKNASRRTPA